MSELHELLVTAPGGFAPLLVEELGSFGAQDLKETASGVRCKATVDVTYQICLYSRLANRVLCPLLQITDLNIENLYHQALQFEWTEVFDLSQTFAIHVAGKSRNIEHTQFAAYRLKDAIADHFRARTERRPNVSVESPDVPIMMHLHGNTAQVSLDLSAGSLHQRGYRLAGGTAPLKENLAAALLYRSKWRELAETGAHFVDPMCGSGTLVLEAAWIAANRPPGLDRRHWGFSGWKPHQPHLWTQAKLAASDNIKPLARGQFRGSDNDPEAIKAARANASRAGLDGIIEWKVCDALSVTRSAETGLLISNPPYGERLGTENELIKLYSLFGGHIRNEFAGWNAAIFSGRPDLVPRMGLRQTANHQFYNGDLMCQLVQFDSQPTLAPQAAEDFRNRLRKNKKHLEKWARRNAISCFRIYDADLPDYALAVDCYQPIEHKLQLHVQEYAAPKTIEPAKAEARLRGALQVLVEEFELTPEQLHYKQRRVQRSGGDKRDQYQRQASGENTFVIDEAGAKLEVNLDDYLDTGVFLDHRPIRQRIQQESKGKRVLNLFAYTGAGTVHAAVGGAVRTVSVDLSRTYLDWAARNLELNGYSSSIDLKRHLSNPSQHKLIAMDCVLWLKQQASEKKRTPFDIIFCDPPTFSNSKRSETDFDVERDHPEIIANALTLLAKDGVLYFSCNKKKFKLDESIDADVEDITASTLDEDFKRPPPSHRCWKISHKK